MAERYQVFMASSKYHAFCSQTRHKRYLAAVRHALHAHRKICVAYKCLRSESSLVYGITRRGILCGQMDSIIGRNVLNCSLSYKISLENSINLHFQPREIYSYYRTIEGSSALCLNFCNVEMVL